MRNLGDVERHVAVRVDLRVGGREIADGRLLRLRNDVGLGLFFELASALQGIGPFRNGPHDHGRVFIRRCRSILFGRGIGFERFGDSLIGQFEILLLTASQYCHDRGPPHQLIF